MSGDDLMSSRLVTEKLIVCVEEVALFRPDCVPIVLPSPKVKLEIGPVLPIDTPTCCPMSPVAACGKESTVLGFACASLADMACGDNLPLCRADAKYGKRMHISLAKTRGASMKLVMSICEGTKASDMN